MLCRVQVCLQDALGGRRASLAKSKSNQMLPPEIDLLQGIALAHLLPLLLVIHAAQLLAVQVQLHLHLGLADGAAERGLILAGCGGIS